WHPTDDCLVASPRLPRESQTRGAVDADDGDRGDLSQTTLESDTSNAAGVPVLTPWGPDYTGESSLEYGHHVYAAPWRVYVPGCRDGLVQSVWAVVGGVDYDGRGFLSGGVGSSSRGSSTRNLSQ